MAVRRLSSDGHSPAATLEALAKQALDVARKARKHRKSLTGDNFYGNKLAELRADATNAFSDLASQSIGVGETTALVELIEAVFAADTTDPNRLKCFRELSYSLRTTWRQTNSARTNDSGLFPLTILTQAKRGYLVAIGRQMNGCFAQGWFDACAVMMRRLIEISIIEAFESRDISASIKDSSGNYVQLSDLVNRAITEPKFSLSRSTKKFLPRLRDVGHLSAHGRHFQARREDIEKIEQGCRVVIEEFLHHAGLL
jgi:hypothetical protein